MFIPRFYPAFKYDFRPDSYWGPARSTLEAALRNVKGRNRRQMIRDYHSKGLLPALSDDLLREPLDEDTRRSLDRIDPSFIGHPDAEPEWECFGFVLSFNETNLCCGADIERLEDFTRVGSDYYPELGQHCVRAIGEWCQARVTEPAAED